MAKTTVNPVIYAPFVQEAMIRKANLLNMGVVEIDTNPPFKKSGDYFVVPYQKSLDNLTDMTQVTSSSTQVTAEYVDDYEIRTYAVEVGKGITRSEYEDIRRGANAIAQLGSQIGSWTGQQIQKYLVSAVKGVFATALASTHVHDISTVGDGKISYDGIIDAKALLGEAQEEFDTIIMNTKQFNDLKKDNLVSWLPAENFGGTVLRTGVIPSYDGMKIVINNTLCAKYNDGINDVYPAYITAGKPLYLGYQRNIRLYDKFEPDIGGGTWYKFWYVDFGVSVKGLSYTNASLPTLALLEDGSSWTKKFPDEHIKMIKLITK